MQPTARPDKGLRDECRGLNWRLPELLAQDSVLDRLDDLTSKISAKMVHHYDEDIYRNNVGGEVLFKK